MNRHDRSSTESKARPPSTRDVAERAGVSVSTVSLVVNNKVIGRVSARNQQAVRDAVAALGYRIDPVARGLATGRRGTVAVILPDLDSSFFNYVTMGITRGLGDDLQMLLVLEKREAGLDSMIDRVLAMRVDAILYEGANAGVLLARGDIHCPVVVLDDPVAAGDGPAVNFDLTQGASDLADHLISLGHCYIGYVTPSRDAPTFRVRRAAFHARLRTRTRHGSVLHVANADSSMEATAAVVDSCWHEWRRQGVTALVCATDTQAYGALLALRRLDVPVPDALSVASFDDLPFSMVVSPQLTAVALPAYDLGSEAIRLLRRALHEPSTSLLPVVLPTQLMIRESTGPATALPRRAVPTSHRCDIDPSPRGYGRRPG